MTALNYVTLAIFPPPHAKKGHFVVCSLTDGKGGERVCERKWGWAMPGNALSTWIFPPQSTFLILFTALFLLFIHLLSPKGRLAKHRPLKGSA